MRTFQPVSLKVMGPAKRNVPGESSLWLSLPRSYDRLHRGQKVPESGPRRRFLKPRLDMSHVQGPCW